MRIATGLKVIARQFIADDRGNNQARGRSGLYPPYLFFFEKKGFGKSPPYALCY
jgi:hypothetical protein